MRTARCISLFAGVALGATLAHADEGSAPRTSSLSWVRMEGAEGCVATQALAAAIEAKLRRKVFVSASEADLSVEGRIERASPRGFRARIAVRDRSGALVGTRDLETADACSSLDESLALVISILIDPEAEPTPPQDPPPPPPPPPPPQIVVQRERVLVPVTTPAPPPWRVEIGAASTLALGLLPGAALGVTASVVVQPPRGFGVLLAGTYLPPRSAEVAPAARAEASLARAGLGICPPVFARGVFSARACGGVTAGAMRSTGAGFDRDTSADALTLAVGAQGRLAVRILPPLFFVLAVSVEASLARGAITYRDTDGTTHELFRTSPVAALGDAGLSLLLP